MSVSAKKPHIYIACKENAVETEIIVSLVYTQRESKYPPAPPKNNRARGFKMSRASDLLAVRDRK